MKPIRVELLNSLDGLLAERAVSVPVDGNGESLSNNIQLAIRELLDETLMMPGDKIVVSET